MDGMDHGHGMGGMASPPPSSSMTNGTMMMHHKIDDAHDLLLGHIMRKYSSPTGQAQTPACITYPYSLCLP